MTDRPLTVVYDDQCPFCVTQVRWLDRLDRRDRLSLLPASAAREAASAWGVTPEALETAIHCVSSNGRVSRGARCLRQVAMRVPLLIPLGLVLWVPGVLWVAERVYGRISRNRHRLSRWLGCRGSCPRR